MAELVRIRDLGSGRIEHEKFGSTPFADVPPSPYYMPSPGSFFTTRAWMDADGQHVIVAHDCKTTREVHQLPWPTWQALSSLVDPSYDCGECGLHAFVPVGFEEVR